MVRYELPKNKNKKQTNISTAYSYFNAVYGNDRRHLFGANIHNQQRY